MIFACGVLQLPLLVDLLNEAFGVGRMVQSSVSKVPPGVAACIIVGLVYVCGARIWLMFGQLYS